MTSRTSTYPLLWCLTLCGHLHGAEQFVNLRSFGDANLAGATPGELVEAPDGSLIGCARVGGPQDVGSVFRFNPQTSTYQTLWSFAGGTNDGADPRGVSVTSDGIIYGVTAMGGAFGGGILFRFNTDTFTRELLHNFRGTSDGRSPTARPIMASDGRLFGVTSSGGISNVGTIFRVDGNGGNFTLLHQFTGQAGSDGANPSVNLTEGSDGNLYGVTFSGGTANRGCVFRLAKDGSGYLVMRSFTGSSGDGGFPDAALLEASDGALYGTTSGGGATGLGTIFKMERNGTGYTVLRSFAGAGDGAEPHAALLEGTDGMLYGTTTRGGTGGLGVVFRMSKAGSTFSVLRSFTINVGDGRSPVAPLVRSLGGFFYGTTTSGGKSDDGAIFRILPDGTLYSVQHDFSRTGPDSAEPNFLAESSDGTLFGTASGGGAFGGGTVFRISPAGSNYAVLHVFGGIAGSGIDPNCIVVSGNGVIYGTTRQGGNHGGGTVFKMNQNGSDHTVLWAFGGKEGDGAMPTGIMEATDGLLYGTTRFGGSLGAGTLFALNKDGTQHSVLRHFGAAGDGGIPEANVIEGADGRLYGTTFDGGSFSFGTLFRLNKNGSGYSILRHFGATPEDARNPHGILTFDGGKSLFGTTQSGGTNEAGTVFRIDDDGANYTILRSFSDSGVDPRHFRSGLVVGANGFLFGTSPAGGNFKFGTVFRLAQDGSQFSIVHSFSGAGRDNADPNTLLRTATGLFGTTSYGGALGVGQLYLISSGSNPIPPILAIQSSAGTTLISVTGGSGDRYSIEAAPTLGSAWMELGKVTNQTGTVSFQDVPNPPGRFYRARLLAP